MTSVAWARLAVVAAVLVPVLWAAVEARPGRLGPVEAGACVLLIVVAVLVVAHRSAGALAAVTAGWVAVFVSRAEIDSLVGVAALAPAVAAVAVLAGRAPRSGRADRAVLGVAPPLAAAGVALVTSELDTALTALVCIVVLTIAPWTVGRWLRSHDERARAGWDRARLWERTAEQAEADARRRERDRLAAEMHDLIGHELARVALGIGALEVDPGLDGDRRAAAGRVRAGVTAAAERLADVVQMLRTDAGIVGPTSIAEVLSGARLSGVTVTVDTAAEPRDPLIAETARRVLAEALTNAMIHAPGAPVRVVVTDGERVVVQVENGAGGAAAPHPGGAGLVGLAERVRLVGGRVTAGPFDGGWRVVANMPPVPAAPAPADTDTAVHERQATASVARSGRRAAIAALAVAVVAGALVAAAMVTDAATSVLHPADYARLTPGTPLAEVEAVLPWRTRIDDPDTGVLDPPGATCAHYSTHSDPFGARRRELYRLCFAGDQLVDKALLVRSGTGSATVVR